MTYFKPEFRRGDEEPLPFQFWGYRCNFLWPLAKNSTRVAILIHYGCVFVSLAAFSATVFAEFTFMSQNFKDLVAMSDCLSTTCMGFQYTIRIMLRVRDQAYMRALFERFYKEIYFTNSDDPQLRLEIRKKLRIPDFFTKIYYSAMVALYAKFIWDICEAYSMHTDKPYIYQMSFLWYDAQQTFAYIITSLYSGWLTLACVALMSAETFSLCLILCHLCYRFKELHKRLDSIFDEARTESQRTAATAANPAAGGCAENVHRIFRQKLYGTFQKQQKLYSFIADARKHFTYQIFYVLSFGVALLCVISFQFQRTTIGLGWAKYTLWLMSNTSEFILIGHFGQLLTDTTMKLSESYYMCHWEAVLPYGNVHSNKLLMRDIRFAIMNAQKPLVMDGLKFLSLTHRTVGNGLRSAISYYMFLNTMTADSEKK